MKIKKPEAWMDSLFKGLDTPLTNLAEIKLRWYSEQNKVTKRTLKPYLK